MCGGGGPALFAAMVTSGWPNALVQTQDGGFALAGYATNDPQFALFRATATGKLLWQRTYGKGSALKIALSPGGGFWLVGNVGPQQQPTLIRTDADGNALWQESYSGGYFGWAVATFDGGIALGGAAATPESDTNARLLRLDGDGNIL